MAAALSHFLKMVSEWECLNGKGMSSTSIRVKSLPTVKGKKNPVAPCCCSSKINFVPLNLFLKRSPCGS